MALMSAACGGSTQLSVNTIPRAELESRLESTGVTVSSTCLLLRADEGCPPSGLETAAQIVQRGEPTSERSVVCNFDMPLWRLLMEGPTQPYCARIVHHAAEGSRVPSSEVVDWQPSLGGNITGLQLGHQDGSLDGAQVFTLRPYARVEIKFGGVILDGQEVYDPDGDHIPNLTEVQLGLRPYDADDMDPPLAMVRVPGGQVIFGSDVGDALPSEGPGVLLQAGELLVDPTEVTQRQYRVCMGRAGDDGKPACRVPALDEFSPLPRAIRRDSERLPVVGVTHAQATAFCAARGMRLPTEAEWEHLARRGSGSSYPWGEFSDEDFAAELAGNNGQNPCRLGRFTLYTAEQNFPRYCLTRPFDVEEVMDANGAPSRPAQSFGLYDLAGNAAEWTQDTFDPAAHERLANGATSPIVDDAAAEHVAKGGSFWSGPRFVRGYARAAISDADLSVTTLGAVGLRCVRTP